MAQNSRFTEPRETRATAMNRADVYRELYNAVEFNLFGAGSWPADREASAAFWKLLDDLGLTTDDPDKPGTTRPPFVERAKAATARSISLASRTLIGLTSTPTDDATAWMLANLAIP